MPHEIEALADEFLELVLQGKPADMEAFLGSRPELGAAEREQLRRFADSLKPFGEAPRALEPMPMMDAAAGSAGGVVVAQAGGLLQRLRDSSSRGGRYRVLGEVARGGMGLILEAWDGELRRKVAMKLALRREAPGATPQALESRALSRLLEEAQITGQLEHPGIVPVHELGLASDGQVYFTMRLVQGRDLRAVLGDVRAGRDGWSVTRALGVMQRVCEAMSYAHSKGVIHRDLKPSNVMVGAFGEVYVMDWGLARVLGKESQSDCRAEDAAVTTERFERRGETPDSPILTQAGDVVGTPSYMAPEQARSEFHRIGPQSDVHAVGAMLYELCAGAVPYSDRGAMPTHRETLERLRRGPPARLESLAPRTPPELVAICERAMQREIEQRYPTMQALGDDLRAFLEGRVVRAHRTGTWIETKKWVQRNRALAASLGAGILIAISGSIAFYLKAQQASRSEDSARQRAYLANIVAAQASLAANESGAARARLEKCEETQKLNWEWRHIHLAADTSLDRYLGLPDMVHDIAFAIDDSRVYAGVHHGTVQAWQPTTQEAQNLAEVWFRRGYAVDFYAVAASPDGRQVAAGGHAGKLMLIDLDHVEEEPADLRGHERGILGLAFSPDGQWLASAADEDTVRVWDMRTRTTARFLRGHGGAVYSVAFSPDGTRLASASSDRTVRIWDWRAGASMVLRGHTSIVRSVAFSPDGSRLASGGDDWTVRAWDATNGEALLTLQGHSGVVRRVCFNRDGSLVASASEDKSIRVWDASTGYPLAVHLGNDSDVNALGFAHNSDQLASGSKDRALRLWNARTGSVSIAQSHDGFVDSVVFSSDGSSVITEGQDGAVCVWDPQLATPLTVVHGRVASRASAVLAADGSVVVGLTDECRRLVVWSMQGPQEPLEIQLPVLEDWGYRGVMSASGNGFALHGQISGDPVSGPGKGSVSVWRCDSGLRGWPEALAEAPLRTFASPAAVESIALSSDSRLVALACSGRLDVWDVDSGDLLLSAPADSAAAMQFDPEGRRLFLGLHDNTIEIWDIRAGRSIDKLTGHIQQVRCLAFSPTEKRLASGSEDHTIRIWDSETYQLVAVLRGHSECVKALAFSDDGTRLASGSEDCTLRIWHTQPVRERLRGDEEVAGLQYAAEQELERRLRAGVTAAELVKTLGAAGDLDPKLRERCIGLARAEGDDPDWLTEQAWVVVRTPSATRASYARALRRAERACSLSAENPRSLLARGAAHLRRGETSAAILDLERSAASAPGEPDCWPFLAMAYWRAGRADDAQVQLDKLSEIMRAYGRVAASGGNYRRIYWDDDPDLQALQAEAAELLSRPGR